MKLYIISPKKSPYSEQRLLSFLILLCRYFRHSKIETVFFLEQDWAQKLFEPSRPKKNLSLKKLDLLKLIRTLQQKGHLKGFTVSLQDSKGLVSHFGRPFPKNAPFPEGPILVMPLLAFKLYHIPNIMLQIEKAPFSCFRIYGLDKNTGPKKKAHELATLPNALLFRKEKGIILKLLSSPKRPKNWPSFSSLIMEGLPLAPNEYYHFSKILKTDFKPRPILFLDRDGVLIKDKKYLTKKEQVEIIQEMIPLLHFAMKKKMRLIVVTNQSVVAKGKLKEDSLQSIHHFIDKLLLKEKVIIDKWLYSPFHPGAKLLKYKKESLMRKPSPGMILQALKEYPCDLSRSLMVGDKNSDEIQIEGLKTFLIRGDYPLIHSHKAIFAETFADLFKKIKNEVLHRKVALKRP